MLNNKASRIQSPRYKAAQDTIYRAFFHTLPTLVHCLYRSTDPEEPRPRFKTPPLSRFLSSPPPSIENINLEYFMAEAEDRLRYRQLLQRVNLGWNKVASHHDLVAHLVSTHVCPLAEEADDAPPDSLHYTPLTTQRYPTEKQGPALWGPYFWKIFHFIGDLEPQEGEEDILYMQDVFIGLINSLVPCPLCESNYNRRIKPSDYPNALRDHRRVYRDIHERVTRHVNVPTF